MKRSVLVFLIAACAIFLSSCEKYDPVGFKFGEDPRFEVTSNAIYCYDMHYDPVPVKNGFYQVDEDGTYHIFLNICDPLLAQKLVCENSPYGVVLVLNKKYFGQVLNSRPEGQRISFGKYLPQPDGFGRDMDGSGSDGDIISWKLYVDVLKDGTFIIKYHRQNDIGIDDKAVYYKGPLQEQPNLEQRLLESTGAWFTSPSISSVKRNPDIKSHRLSGYIPEYVTVHKIWFEYTTLKDHVFTDKKKCDLDISELKYNAKETRPGYITGFNDMYDLAMQRVSANYELTLVPDGSMYQVDLVALLSYKGYTVTKTIGGDYFYVQGQ